jgi:hypothetical protein
MKKIDTEMVMLGALLGGSPAAIIAQEKHGQKALANSTELPVKIDPAAQKVLSEWGVQLGDVLEDKLFRQAILPKGWKKVPTEHSMYTDLVDDKGRKRASIFYKAAFYDRDAFLSIERRLHAAWMKDDFSDRSEPMFPCIKDSNGNVLWRGKPVKDATKLEDWRMATEEERKLVHHERVSPSDDARFIASKVLLEAYPDCESYTAYWDIDVFDKLPPSKSEAPKGERYRQHISLYREDGSFADSGADQTRVYETPEIAIQKQEAHLRKAFGGRYNVKWSLETLDGKQIHRGEINTIRPRRASFNSPFNDCDYGWRH